MIKPKRRQKNQNGTLTYLPFLPHSFTRLRFCTTSPRPHWAPSSVVPLLLLSNGQSLSRYERRQSNLTPPSRSLPLPLLLLYQNWKYAHLLPIDPFPQAFWIAPIYFVIMASTFLVTAVMDVALGLEFGYVTVDPLFSSLDLLRCRSPVHLLGPAFVH